jgi:5-formyltetrahydrofolate cyclo-ligase
MMDEIKARKQVLRRELNARLRTGPPEERSAEAKRVMARLVARPEWLGADRVMLFAPTAEEMDLWPLAVRALREGRRLALPRFDPRARTYHAATVTDLERDVVGGSFGIREPGPSCPSCPLNELDFVLVPGLGFDACGRRLGRGKGYYDRLLAMVRGTACGVAMDWQVLPEVPAEPHDRSVDCILTPSRWLVVPRRIDET